MGASTAKKNQERDEKSLTSATLREERLRFKSHRENVLPLQQTDANSEFNLDEKLFEATRGNKLFLPLISEHFSFSLFTGTLTKYKLDPAETRGGSGSLGTQ
jgi:hypothetical protein